MGTLKSNLKINEINLLSGFKIKFQALPLTTDVFQYSLAFKVITSLGRYTKSNPVISSGSVTFLEGDRHLLRTLDLHSVHPYFILTKAL